MKKRGVALVMTVFFLAFFLAIGLNMFFISLGSVKKSSLDTPSAIISVSYDFIKNEIKVMEEFSKEELSDYLKENYEKIDETTDKWERKIGDSWKVVVEFSEEAIEGARILLDDEETLELEKDEVSRIIESFEKDSN